MEEGEISPHKYFCAYLFITSHKHQLMKQSFKKIYKLSNNSLVRNGFTLIELLVVIAIIGVLASIVIAALSSSRVSARDAERVSDIRQIRYALELYRSDFNAYPSCLIAGGSCTTVLQNAKYMSAVPKDPLTGLSYSYAGLGSGAICSSYHLGSSLEDKHNKALQTGIDSSPQGTCTGSAADFSGLSFVAGGQLCNTTAGTAQPTNAANGESCYDVGPQ